MVVLAPTGGSETTRGYSSGYEVVRVHSGGYGL